MAVYKVTVDEAVTTLGVTEAVTILSEQVTGVQGATGLTGATGATGSSGVVGVDSGELTNTGTSTSAQLGLATAGTAGTYTKVTTDTFGRVTTGTTLVAGDIPTISATQVTGTATTIATLQNKLMQSNTFLETVPRVFVNVASSGATPNGRAVLTYFTPEQTLSISSLTIATTTGGTDTGGTTVRRMGIYTFSGSAHTLVARTASDATIGNASNTVFTRSLDTTGGYPSSYTLTAGTTYAFAVIFYNTGGTFASPTIFVSGTGQGTLRALTPVETSFQSSQTDLPATTSSFTNGNGFMVYGRLS